MRLTRSDKSNLIRFGATLPATHDVVYISLEHGKKEAESANILVRGIYTKWPAGPLFCLAFEISPTKARSHYYFFPFNLRNKRHRNYLSKMCNAGKIRLTLLSNSRKIVREYLMPSRQHNKIVEACATAIADTNNFSFKEYDFDRAVSDFEQNTRIVHYFDYLVSQPQLRDFIQSVEAQADGLAPAHRDKANKLASDLLEVFRPRYQGWIAEQVKRLPWFLHGVRLLSDLQEAFEGDESRFLGFLRNAIATSVPESDFPKMENLRLILESLCKFADRLEEDIRKKGPASPEQEKALRDILSRIVSGQGMSLGALQELLSIFGLQITGKPGRPPKDYSREYALKAEGKTWRAIAEQSLQSDPETQRELGAHNYIELGFQQQEMFKHRIREGVRGYAKRIGKPFPPPKAEDLALPPTGANNPNPNSAEQ